MKLRIKAGKVSLTVDLLDTPTAKALLAAAPFEARAQGDALALPYGRTPLSTDERPNVKAGQKITVSKA